MTEKFLHFIWNMGLFQQNNIRALTGENIEVVKLGVLNKDAGPDFLNAQVRINGTLWAGNVEMHVKASDWNKHNHHIDPNYNNVILHVVDDTDIEIYRMNGESIPTMKLTYSREYLKNYTELEISDRWIPCEDKIRHVDPFLIHSWMEVMMVDRLQEKTKSIEKLLSETKGDWEQTFFITFCKSLGQKVNGFPFEQLGKSIDVNHLKKYKGYLVQLEALLFGQAGFLLNTPQDDYQALLKAEYVHLRKKHHLQPINGQLWKFHRLRPLNFPTIRIAQLAAFMNRKTGLFNALMHLNKLNELQEFLETDASGYWKNHYQFGKTSHERKKALGKNTIDILIINTIVPFLFSYGKHNQKQYLEDRALDLLSQMKPENNSISKCWRSLGVVINNALDSQAGIQLKNKFCDSRKCLSCRIGMQIISMKS
jgi:hypothetical protein